MANSYILDLSKYLTKDISRNQQFCVVRCVQTNKHMQGNSSKRFGTLESNKNRGVRQHESII